MAAADAMVAITLNGAPHSIPEGCTVAELLDALGLRRDGVAVAVDMQVVPRSAHAGRTIRAGERVEVVQAVGGG